MNKTQLTTLPAQSTPAPAVADSSRYISFFENPAEYAARLDIANALAKTRFVPEAFRNSPEDCLVALDMAARLDLNPIAVFSDIYIIDNRASFSSKFLIALVNRSGRFTRIQFDEGIDGEAEVTFSGWGDQRGQRKTWKEKVPNYYATAYFTELATGEIFKSPRVDMAFAEKNGWFSKNGSKWQTMPEIMARYRAASILIKSVCPEIVMGLEWAEDLQDAREEARATPPPRRYEATPAAPAQILAPPRATSKAVNNEVVVEIVDDSLFQSFGEQINAARDVDALQEVAAAIGEANLTETQKKTLRRVWSARKKELNPVPDLPPAEGLPNETALNTIALMQAIKDATSAEALNDLKAALAQALDAGQITQDEEAGIKATIEARLSEIAAAPDSPSKQQQGYAEEMLRGIDEAASNGEIERLNGFRPIIAEWAENGYLTQGQAKALKIELERALDSLQ